MILKNVLLKNFRNLHKVGISPDKRINVIVGKNGSGKTNFCESLYYSSCGQILKGDRQRELIGWSKPRTLVELDLNTGDEIKIYLNRETGQKITQLNNKNCSPGEIYKYFQVLLFTPDDLQILKGSPRIRRNFFNHKMSDLDANYSNTLKKYESVVGKKNASLKKERIDPHLLEVFNEKIAEYGSIIISKRLKYIQAVNEHLSDIYRKFSTGANQLELRYSGEDYQRRGIDDISEIIHSAIQKKAQVERQKGYCIIGPHRDDFQFLLDGKDVRKYGSQGEHKLSIIAQKLAHLKIHFDRFQDYPVLVMDDIMGELDSGRREKLLDNLPSDIQIFLTYVELVDPLPLLEGSFYRLEEAKLKHITTQNQVAQRE